MRIIDRRESYRKRLAIYIASLRADNRNEAIAIDVARKTLSPKDFHGKFSGLLDSGYYKDKVVRGFSDLFD